MNDRQIAAKKYLNSSRELKVKLEILRDQKEEMIAQATSINAGFNPVKVQTSKNPNKMADAVIKATAIEEKIEKAFVEYLDLQQEQVTRIQHLKNPKYMKMLFKVCIQGKTLKVAALESDISQSYASEVLCKALDEFAMNNADVVDAFI